MIAVDEITIGIVFDHKRVRIKPIIKDLAAQNVPANTPTKLVAILFKPDVTFQLAVEVIDFEAGVVGFVVCLDVSRANEEALVFAP